VNNNNSDTITSDSYIHYNRIANIVPSPSSCVKIGSALLICYTILDPRPFFNSNQL